MSNEGGEEIGRCYITSNQSVHGFRLTLGVVLCGLIALVACIDSNNEDELANLVQQLADDVSGLKDSVEDVLKKKRVS